VGQALVFGLDNGSAVNANDININLPYVVPDANSRSSGNVGAGVALDLGGAWTIPRFRFGVSVQNVVNTFKWDTTKFAMRASTKLFTADTTIGQNDKKDRLYANAPAALRA